MAYYAFCRRADDIADGDYIDYFPGGSSEQLESINYRTKIERLIDSSPVVERSSYNDKMSQLFYFRKKLSTAYGEVTSTDPIFIALKDTVDTFGIPRQLLDDMISGMEEDFHRNRYETFEDLYTYCYKVASAVGMACLKVFGENSPAGVEYGRPLGLALPTFAAIGHPPAATPTTHHGDRHRNSTTPSGTQIYLQQQKRLQTSIASITTFPS